MPLYPLLLEPIYKEKVWGGRSLERLGRTLPGGPATSIGESWELADLASTSPSGGGGDPAHSRILNGPLMKRTLNDVMNDFGPLLTGEKGLSAGSEFPLLLKYLDARENLSVQVHPSADYAAEHPGAHLKSEAWYVVAADPGAVIYKGVREGTSRAEFEAAIADGSVVDLLISVAAVPGDCHYLPSGTCHALGAGILVAEVQTPSDTTFRVFDWGRTDRELHVEAALDSIDYGPVRTDDAQPTERERVGGETLRHLVACEHFSIDEAVLGELEERTYRHSGALALMVVRGSGRLRWGSDERHELRVGQGQTVLLPAALEQTLLQGEHDMTVLEVALPSASADETTPG